MLLLFFISQSKSNSKAILKDFSTEKNFLCKYFEIDNINIKTTENKNLYIYYSKENKITGHFLTTKFLQNKKNGYGGNLDFLFILDNNMNIIKFFLYTNKETPAFINMLKIKKFFNNWDNLSLTKAHEKKVDTITGATISTNSIIQNSQKLFLELNQIEIKPIKSTIDYKETTFIFLFLILFFMSFLEFYKSSKKRRNFLMFFSIIFAGFIIKKMLSISFIFNRISQDYFLWEFNSDNILNLILFIVFIISLYISTFKKRNYYCYYFCPYGFLQELFSKIKIKKLTIPHIFNNIFKIVRPIFLIFLIALLFFDYSQYTDLFEVFSAFSFINTANSAKILFILFLLISIIIPRFYCRYLCPTGYIFEFLKK